MAMRMQGFSFRGRFGGSAAATRICLVLLAAVTWAVPALAQPYTMPQFVLSGGGGTSAGGAFVVSGTVGVGLAAGTASGGSYTVTPGFATETADPPGPGWPSITITTPTTTGTYGAAASFLTLAGTAADDTGIANVTWASDRGPSGTATGTTTWSAAGIPVFAGANTLTVTAHDLDSPGHSTGATLVVTVTDLSYYLAEGATGAFFDLDLAIANPNAVAAPITITFLKEDATVVTHTMTLTPMSRTSVAVETIPGLEQTATSTVVTSTSALPLVVERSMFWDAGYYGSHGGTAASGPATRWYFAEGSQITFDTYVLLANANAAAATATVRFLTENDGVVTRTVTLPPTSRTNVVAGMIPELAGKSFSIVVEATLPIIAERAMYFGPGWKGGHESMGVTGLSKTWFLAEGATGMFSEWVLVGNPNDAPTHVTLTYLLESAQVIVRERDLAANSRLTVFVQGEAAGMENTGVSTVVESSLPVVAERATYWPAQDWGEAHNSFGVTETATKWGLAEGRVGGPQSFDTYILLANPNTSQAQVRITYLRTTGDPIVKQYTVEATSRYNVPVRSFVPELQNEHFAAVIEVLNGLPIAVERAMYNDDAGGTWWAAGTNASAVKLP